MAQPEAFCSARHPNLAASMVSLRNSGGRATTRASSYEQNWTDSTVGIVGNKLHRGHTVSSFNKEEIEQSRVLRMTERCLLRAAPFCSYRKTLPWSPGCPSSGGPGGNPLSPWNQGTSRHQTGVPATERLGSALESTNADNLVPSVFGSFPTVFWRR